MKDSQKWTMTKRVIAMSALVFAFAAMAVNVFALSPVNDAPLAESLGDYAVRDDFVEEAEMSYVGHVPAWTMHQITFVASDMLGCLDYENWCCSAFSDRFVVHGSVVDFDTAFAWLNGSPSSRFLTGYFRDVHTGNIYWHTDITLAYRSRVFSPVWQYLSVLFVAHRISIDGGRVGGTFANGEHYALVHINFAQLHHPLPMGSIPGFLCQLPLPFLRPIVSDNGQILGWEEYSNVRWHTGTHIYSLDEILSTVLCKQSILSNYQFHFAAIWGSAPQGNPPAHTQT